MHVGSIPTIPTIRVMGFSVTENTLGFGPRDGSSTLSTSAKKVNGDRTTGKSLVSYAKEKGSIPLSPTIRAVGRARLIASVLKTDLLGNP